MKYKMEYFLDSSLKKLMARAVDGAGYAVFRDQKNIPIDTNTVRKILLIRLDHIGDVLMTTPALRALRKAIPGAKIHLLVKDLTAPMVELTPYIDRIIRLNAPWTTTGPEKASWGEVARTVRSLRREKYDCVVDFRPDLREALLAYVTGSRIRIGYGARGGGFCFTHSLPYSPHAHEISRALNLLSPLGISADGNEMDLFLSPEDKEKADRLYPPGGGESQTITVGIHPGAASPFKRWTEKSFSLLGDLLADRGYRVILLSAEEDRPLLAGIETRVKRKPVVILPGGLRVLAALINRLDCLVCNDSAPSHIAQAVGTPAVVLYGPTHDAVTGPLDRERNRVVRNPVSCAPCWLPGSRFSCTYDLRCWEGLGAEEVVKEVESLLKLRKVTIKGYEKLRNVTK